MIYELLSKGEENAKTAKDLAKLLNTQVRVVTLAIQNERREGYPICANAQNGYYLAENKKQLKSYIKKLRNRAKEIRLTVKALDDAVYKI